MADPGGVWSALWADAADLSKVTGWLEARVHGEEHCASATYHFLRAVAQGGVGLPVRRFISTGETDGSTHIGNTTELRFQRRWREW